uniref:Universal stress protein n=1 Tax=Desulfatirhabdium butyrativorans TaxID=340467 RepID=A0A7C4VRY0_9BACT
MFNKILFATTGTPVCDNAAHVAFDIAKKYDAKLHVFHVLGMPSRGFSTTVKDIRTGESEHYDADYVAWVKEELRNTYDKYIKDYLNFDIDAVAGVPSTEILRFARQKDVDLIVMGAHSRQEQTGAARYRGAVGTNMQHVARSARCPVLIVSRPCTTCLWYFSNIVFGTDFSKQAFSAFLFACKLAKAIGSRLHIFHAVDMSSVHAGKIISQEEIEAKIEEARRKIEKTYLPYLDDYDNYDIDIWEGIPYVEILKYSRAKNADLIVMAHHAKEVDPDDAILGSTVEQVVLRASCPVASVNHPDKVSG